MMEMAAGLEALAEPEWLAVVCLTVRVSGLATLISVVVGIPLG